MGDSDEEMFACSVEKLCSSNLAESLLASFAVTASQEVSVELQPDVLNVSVCITSTVMLASAANC